MLLVLGPLRRATLMTTMSLVYNLPRAVQVGHITARPRIQLERILEPRLAASLVVLDYGY